MKHVATCESFDLLTTFVNQWLMADTARVGAIDCLLGGVGHQGGPVRKMGGWLGSLDPAGFPG